jgi:hypothetical protein
MEDSANGAQKLLESFKDGGWLVLCIGGASMLARLSLGGEKMTTMECIKRIFAAIVCGLITWMILENVDIPYVYKVILYSLSGLNAPEVLKGVTKIMKGFGEDPVEFVKELRRGRLYDSQKETRENKIRKIQKRRRRKSQQ